MAVNYNFPVHMYQQAVAPPARVWHTLTFMVRFLLIRAFESLSEVANFHLSAFYEKHSHFPPYLYLTEFSLSIF